MAEHADVAYEPTDARVGGIVAFGIILLLVLAAVHALLAWMLGLMSEQARQRDLPQPAVANERLRLPRDLDKIPPPVLQSNEFVDLAAVRRREDQQLHGYGWVDRKRGIVHIPIDQAMRLYADRQGSQPQGESP